MPAIGLYVGYNFYFHPDSLAKTPRSPVDGEAPSLVLSKSI